MTAADRWNRFRRHLCVVPELGLSLDISRMAFADDFLDRMAPAMTKAYEAMDALEKGAIANPDENRMVGHYWLRAPELAPTPAIQAEIRDTIAAARQFARQVHGGTYRPQNGGKFAHVLSIGIGGSALGPEFVADALGHPPTDALQPVFVDNTDPEGIARVLQSLEGKLDETLVVVMSKSGGTPETRNGQILVAHAYEAAGLDFARHAVAVTGADSKLDKLAKSEGWLARFPMWDWVGGRTSEMSAVGLVPGFLQGLDMDGLLAGAAALDTITRQHDTARNPAALLALMWYHATGGKGAKDMVVLPYKDRLLLFSRYLQQLVMESLGKRLDLDGQRVDQGISVYGNKGSTDQHAYVQQLRDGVANFFLTFIRVLEDGGAAVDVEPGVTAGDYLHGFLLGTREALSDNDRPSLTITVPRVDPPTVGALIALFERAVGFYASLVNINAYHQPGVEAGKKAAAAVLALQGQVVAKLSAAPRPPRRSPPRSAPSRSRRSIWCWSTSPPITAPRWPPARPTPARPRSRHCEQNADERRHGIEPGRRAEPARERHGGLKNPAPSPIICIEEHQGRRSRDVLTWQDRVYGQVALEDAGVEALIACPTFQRLKKIRQAGPSALAFPFKTVTRYEHSLGVFLLLKRLGADRREQVAGLLHDVSHTAFSHAADFIYTSDEQNHHEGLKPAFLHRPDLEGPLRALGFAPEDFYDDTVFPLLEQPLPWMCADRFDYFLRDSLACGVSTSASAARRSPMWRSSTICSCSRIWTRRPTRRVGSRG